MGINPDYYDLLGLPPDATADEIRHAYREAALRHHPDVNPDSDAHERFILVQEAYRVLSDVGTRKAYDRELEETSPAAIKVEILYSSASAAVLKETQLLYVLLNFSPRKEQKTKAGASLNISLVIDRSTSMQGARMDTVKDAAAALIRNLRQQDRVSVVSFSDNAEVVVPSSRNIDPRYAANLIQMIRPSGGTEIYKGLKAGLDEVLNSLSDSQINQILLITDGRTYGDEDQCLRLAETAARRGVSISALGIGADWNDVFIDRLTSLTGGSSFFISQAELLQQMLREQIEKFKETFADRAVLNLTSSPGIKLLAAYRVAPLPAAVPIDGSLHPGTIPNKGTLSMLLEYRIDPLPAEPQRVTIATGELIYDLPGEKPARHESIPIRLTRLVRQNVTADLPPAPIFRALSQLNLYRMQERARYEVSIGKVQEAGKRLHRLATELLNRGEVELAQTAIIEAERIQHTQMLSAQGEKQIKYGTRALLLPSGEPRTEML